MGDRAFHFIHLACMLGAGLIAGTFFAFSTFIMAALARQPVPQSLAMMQTINITVINPVFMGVLFGTAVLGAFAGFVAFRSGASSGVVIGALLYVVGVIGITMACNVPLNNELADLNTQAAESAGVWSRYLTDWTFWNSIRGLAASGACLAFASAL